MHTLTFDFDPLNTPVINSENFADSIGANHAMAKTKIKINPSLLAKEVPMSKTQLQVINEEISSTKLKFIFASNAVLLSISIYLLTPYGLIPLLISGAFLMKQSSHLTTLVLLRFKKRYER